MTPPSHAVPEESLPAGGPSPDAEAVSRDATTTTAPRPEPEAIFIVGVPRSGTTLMRMVLGKHSRIAIADENHYMGHRIPRNGVRHIVRRMGDLRDDDAIRRLVGHLYSDEFQGGSRLRNPSQFWRWLSRQVPRADLERRLLAGERTERGVFTAVLRAYADRKRKAVFGEKTPAHIRWADTLLEWYPGGRVVHMVRDPRAVYRSELKRRNARPETYPYRVLTRVPVLMRAFVVIEVVEAWASAVAHHRSLSRRHPDRYMIIRFEDLVREPEAEIDRLCRFLGVTLEPAMFEQKVVSRGDRLGEEGFDAGAADRWRTSISPGEVRWLGRLLGRRIEEMGYSRL
ncbi:MAG TPA: sulfotransferase [Candidatus Limnocylindrales bacterium]|nr:sulfotransferase [Candidatus Limnocylindrales bacterium]